MPLRTGPPPTRTWGWTELGAPPAAPEVGAGPGPSLQDLDPAWTPHRSTSCLFPAPHLLPEAWLHLEDSPLQTFPGLPSRMFLIQDIWKEWGGGGSWSHRRGSAAYRASCACAALSACMGTCAQPGGEPLPGITGGNGGCRSRGEWWLTAVLGGSLWGAAMALQAALCVCDGVCAHQESVVA